MYCAICDVKVEATILKKESRDRKTWATIARKTNCEIDKTKLDIWAKYKKSIYDQISIQKLRQASKDEANVHANAKRKREDIRSETHVDVRHC